MALSVKTGSFGNGNGGGIAGVNKKFIKSYNVTANFSKAVNFHFDEKLDTNKFYYFTVERTNYKESPYDFVETYVTGLTGFITPSIPTLYKRLGYLYSKFHIEITSDAFYLTVDGSSSPWVENDQFLISVYEVTL